MNILNDYGRSIDDLQIRRRRDKQPFTPLVIAIPSQEALDELDCDSALFSKSSVDSFELQEFEAGICTPATDDNNPNYIYSSNSNSNGKKNSDNISRIIESETPLDEKYSQKTLLPNNISVKTTTAPTELLERMKRRWKDVTTPPNEQACATRRLSHDICVHIVKSVLENRKRARINAGGRRSS
jgi:hypothetical protein